jgi:hypothetical protein
MCGGQWGQSPQDPSCLQPGLHLCSFPRVRSSESVRSNRLWPELETPLPSTPTLHTHIHSISSAHTHTHILAHSKHAYICKCTQTHSIRIHSHTPSPRSACMSSQRCNLQRKDWEGKAAQKIPWADLPCPRNREVPDRGLKVLLSWHSWKPDPARTVLGLTADSASAF